MIDVPLSVRCPPRLEAHTRDRRAPVWQTSLTITMLRIMLQSICVNRQLKTSCTYLRCSCNCVIKCYCLILCIWDTTIGVIVSYMLYCKSQTRRLLEKIIQRVNINKTHKKLLCIIFYIFYLYSHILRHITKQIYFLDYL